MLRFKAIFVLLFLLVFACKKEIKKTVSKDVTSEKVNSTDHFKLQTKGYDFSSIPKDTFLIKGKQILFIKPSVKELKILHNVAGIKSIVSSYNNYTAAVKDSLKEYYNIATTSKRIIAIQLRADKTIYIDRLTSKKDWQPIHFGMFMVFNRYHQIISKAHADYYGIIQEYYNTIRFEKPIATKYVIARNGLNIRDQFGSIIGKYNNGDFVNVLGYSNQFKEIEDEGKIINGRTAIVRWEDDYNTPTRGYVFEGYLGDLKDVKVYQDQLCNGRNYEVKKNGEIDFSPKEFTCLKKYFDFELITKKAFENIPKLGPSFLVKNKQVIVTKDSIILPLQKGKVVYKNKDIDTESRAIYQYYGDFDFLNAYVLLGSYWEDSGFFFVDRASGKAKYYFEGFPEIAPNKKRLLEFSYNPYEEMSGLEIYSIEEDHTIVPKQFFNFEFWTALPDENTIKWIDNNTFAVKIQQINTIGRSSRAENIQYLKLRIK